ncbi:LysR family transcriptional regulator [Salinarimonas rosea]|uniref:LysR family transcriptional regulator n=1 Tax=Salinarimonas rosea TaxID=552063 RepID=UPI001FDAC944|nr:LysR family transcriptional regulator [Salinarimonas rosea]
MRRSLIHWRMDGLDWNLVRAFRATAEAGSLSAAARRIGATQPTLSRQVAALEAALGATLFDRVGKRLVLTDLGRGLLEHAQAMGAAADAMALAAAGRAADVSGRVTISATDAVCAYLLPDVVARLRREAPRVTLVLVASNALSDLRRREADIAVRHVRPAEPELIGRRVGEMVAHFYAAESWIARRGRPRTLADVPPGEIMGFEPLPRFVEHLVAEGHALTEADFRIVSENAVVLWELVRRGVGVGIVLREIAERLPGLVRLFPDAPGTEVPLWLVTHREMRTSRRVRVVFEALAEGLGGG